MGDSLAAVRWRLSGTLTANAKDMKRLMVSLVATVMLSWTGLSISFGEPVSGREAGAGVNPRSYAENPNPDEPQFKAPPPGWPWRGMWIAGNNFPWRHPLPLTVSGAARQDAIDHHLQGDEVTATDIAHLAALGVNSVAISVDVRSMLAVANVATRNTSPLHNLTVDQALVVKMRWLDTILDACRKNGVVAILTGSQFPMDPHLGLTQISPEYWGRPALQADTVRRIGEFAKHFSNRGRELGAYDFLTEPLVNGATPTDAILFNGKTVPAGTKLFGTPRQWPALQEAIIRIIRKYDHRHYIIIKPGYGGEPGAYAGFTAPDHNGLIYSAHMYDPHYFTHNGIYTPLIRNSYPSPLDPNLTRAGLEKFLKPFFEWTRANHAYAYVGEFSSNRWSKGGDQYVADLIGIFDAHNAGWEYVGAGGWNGWDPSYNSVFQPDALQHNDLTYWVGINTPRWRILIDAYRQNLRRARSYTGF